MLDPVSCSDPAKRSAWLDVPLDDYEGHMRAPAVGQLGVLSDLFAEALALCRPASVAILGIAGGNGLEAIDRATTTRVVGVDINARYLADTGRRFGGVPGLTLHCLDLSRQPLDLEPVDLVHAALIFEHAGIGRCLENALAIMAPAGRLSVVLQLPGDSSSRVAPTGFASVQKLSGNFALVDRERFVGLLTERRCELVRQRTYPLPAGKAFWMGIFAHSAD
jgi:hypothetical protein